MKAELDRRKTNTERLWEFFQQHPREWIEARDLEFAGRQAWRTRLSELRRRRERDNLGTIENRVPRTNGGRTVLSLYRFLPYRPEGRDSTQPTPALPLFDDGPWSR